MKEYHLTVKGNWKGGRTGQGTVASNGFSMIISTPSDLDGSGKGTSPEELYLSAAASCYVITLSIMLSNRNVQFEEIRIDSEGKLVQDGSLSFDSVTHRPTVVLPAGSQNYVDAVKDYAIQADHACIISRASRGNVSFRVEPTVIVQP